ncbi:hypothetical protein Tco_1137441 [Tanacetum coccineum]
MESEKLLKTCSLEEIKKAVGIVIVSKEQSAFIAGRQILDGPVILSEIIEWWITFSVTWSPIVTKYKVYCYLRKTFVDRFHIGQFTLGKLIFCSFRGQSDSLSQSVRMVVLGLNIGSLKAFNMALLQNGLLEVAFFTQRHFVYGVIKSYLVKKGVSIQIVVASRGNWLTLLGPPIFSTSKG